MAFNDVKLEYFPGLWKIYYQVNENFYIMYRFKNNKLIYAPLYIHSFKLVNRSEQEKAFLCNTPELGELKSVSDKLKWYRCKNGISQSEVADVIGVDRTTYSRYERNILNAYPIDKLSMIAELFKIDVTALLDEYNLFLYHGQGKQIKKLRKSLELTQSEFAKNIGIPLGTLKKWEQNRIKINKTSYLKIINMNK